jgi:hypothetical protein
MRRTHASLSAVVLIAAATLCSASPARREARALPPRNPVVVELFTSEGCSSCPPADALLAELDRTQPVPGALIIPLEEHVDYWNSDGWRDPFSSAAFTSRQEAYARRFGTSGPYTPQMVVAGRTELLGSASREARAAISAAAREPRIEVSLVVAAGTPPDAALRATIRVEAFPQGVREAAEVFLAITEDGLASQVSAGENSGHRLEHRAVVRKLISAGRAEPGRPFAANVDGRIAPAWKRENLRVVVFLEGASTGQILGAATSPAIP